MSKKYVIILLFTTLTTHSFPTKMVDSVSDFQVAAGVGGVSGITIGCVIHYFLRSKLISIPLGLVSGLAAARFMFLSTATGDLVQAAAIAQSVGAHILAAQVFENNRAIMQALQEFYAGKEWPLVEAYRDLGNLAAEVRKGIKLSRLAQTNKNSIAQKAKVLEIELNDMLKNIAHALVVIKADSKFEEQKQEAAKYNKSRVTLQISLIRQ